jgi:hypothetical protein
VSQYAKSSIKYTFPTREFQNHFNTEQELSEVTFLWSATDWLSDFAMEPGFTSYDNTGVGTLELMWVCCCATVDSLATSTERKVNYSKSSYVISQEVTGETCGH